MKLQYLKNAKFLSICISRLEKLQLERDLPELHRLSVDLQTFLSELVVHENRVLFLDALRVNNVEGIPQYAERLKARLEELHQEYREKAEKPGLR